MDAIRPGENKEIEVLKQELAKWEQYKTDMVEDIIKRQIERCAMKLGLIRTSLV